MKIYFNNKNYIMLYLDNLLSNFANSIYAVFTPVILYKAGVHISLIVLIYALQFLVMGIFTPLSGYFSKKYGIAFTKFLSYVLKTISLLFVLNVRVNMKYYFLISVTYGLSGAINNPLNTFIPSKIVSEDFRGRFNTFKYILRCCSSILGYIFAAVFLIKNNNCIIIVTVLLSYILSTIALFNLDNNRFCYNFEKSFKDSYYYLLKNKNQKLKRVSGFRSAIIIERVIVIPLYLYIALKDLKVFTIVYVISTIIEMFSLFITGINLDRDSKKTFSVVSCIKGIISFSFLTFRNKYILIANQSLYKLVDNVYDSSYCALSQNRVETDADKDDTLILSMISEMSLCFYEFIMLSLLFVISLLNELLVFKIVFILSIIAVIVNNQTIKKWQDD